MAIKQALIVDDSKSARVVLKRMLEGLDLVANTVESATDAIEYLKKRQPDVIFMDHMMPGMDGFEAVKHIKNNSQTAVIPIMVYTSRGGDVYLSQARALGAVGIIPKTISPVGLKESLFKLGLIEDRRKPLEENELIIDDKPARVESTPAKTSEQSLEDDLVENQTKHDTYLEDLQRVLDDQTIELHKSMWLGIESVSHEIFNRLSSEIDDRFESLQNLPQDVADKLVVNRIPRVMLAVSVLLLVSIILNIYLLSSTRKLDNSVTTIIEEHVVVAETSPVIIDQPTIDKAAIVKFIEASQNKKIDYPFNELALNDVRLEFIEAVVKKALDVGYTGNIILQTHIGKFCMNSDVNGGYILAENDLSMTRCEYVGNNMQPTDAPATHQSLSFANYLSDSGALNEKGIFLEVTNESRVIELLAYPKRISETTVKEWNLAAQANNRVTVILEPASF